MPLDGAMVATPPAGTTAVPNTVVASAPYNALKDDIYNIFNTKVQPVTAGGTGRTTPTLPDSVWEFINSVDNTKRLGFDLAAITTATKRTLAVPDYSGQISVLARGTDIATAATINLTTATGDIVDLTGTVNVTAVTLADGLRREARAVGSALYTASASLIINGSTTVNYTSLAGDLLVFRGYAAGVVRMWVVSRLKPVLGTSQLANTNTSIDFTAIPAGVKRITLMFSSISTNGTSNIIVQLGTASGIETSGYLGASGSYSTVSAASNFTAGFGLAESIGAAAVLHGLLIFSLIDASSNTWVAGGGHGRSNVSLVGQMGGSKPLVGVLDRLRITMANGTDIFDAGTFNILYE